MAAAKKPVSKKTTKTGAKPAAKKKGGDFPCGSGAYTAARRGPARVIRCVVRIEKCERDVSGPRLEFGVDARDPSGGEFPEPEVTRIVQAPGGLDIADRQPRHAGRAGGGRRHRGRQPDGQ